jgi:hypothetical protein
LKPFVAPESPVGGRVATSLMADAINFHFDATVLSTVQRYYYAILRLISQNCMCCDAP